MNSSGGCLAHSQVWERCDLADETSFAQMASRYGVRVQRHDFSMGALLLGD